MSLVRLLFVLASALLAQSALAVACTSAGSGNWTAITWTGCAGGPAAADDVTIRAADTVSLNTSTTVNSLTVAGTFTFGNNNSNRSLTVSGTVTVTGTVNISNNNNTHTWSIGGDFSNTGTVNLRTT